MTIAIVVGTILAVTAGGILIVGGIFLYRLARMGPGMGMVFRTGYGPLFRK